MDNNRNVIFFLMVKNFLSRPTRHVVRRIKYPSVLDYCTTRACPTVCWNYAAY